MDDVVQICDSLVHKAVQMRMINQGRKEKYEEWKLNLLSSIDDGNSSYAHDFDIVSMG